MTRTLSAGWRTVLVLAVLLLGAVPSVSPAAPGVALAQQDVSADPKAVSPAASDLRPGFYLVPEKTEQREPVPGIVVYEADFVRDQTPANLASGPIEIKSLVARTANSQQAAEQFASSRQALTTASPPWVESKVAKLGDEAIGLTMEGTSNAGPAVAHLYLFRRGAMVVGITVAGLVKPTRMAEAEAIAAVVLRKIDPSIATQTGPRVQRPLNLQRPPATASSGTSSTGATTPMSSSSSGGQRVRVAKTDGSPVRLRTQPSLSAPIAARIPEGTELEVVGEDRTADGYTWRNVRAPGDGRGWVAAEYLVPVSGSGASGSGASGSGAQASAAPASAESTQRMGSGSSSSPGASASGAATPAQLKVDVSAKRAKVKSGDEQTIEITVTKDGQPVSGAQVTVRTSPTNDAPDASATDANGKTTVTWKPSGTGTVGVGVSVQTADGSAGSGGVSFEITAS